MLNKLGSVVVFTEQKMNNKVDSVQTKVKELCKGFSMKGKKPAKFVDVQAAAAFWVKFSTHQQLFSKHPTWSPGSCTESCSIGEVVVVASSTIPQAAVTAAVVVNLHC